MGSKSQHQLFAGLFKRRGGRTCEEVLGRGRMQVETTTLLPSGHENNGEFVCLGKDNNMSHGLSIFSVLNAEAAFLANGGGPMVVATKQPCSGRTPSPAVVPSIDPQ